MHRWQRTMENVAMFRDAVCGQADVRSVFIDQQMTALMRSFWLRVLYSGLCPCSAAAAAAA